MTTQPNIWADFTRTNYKNYLSKATQLYSLGVLADWSESNVSCVWRHDVDGSPHAALALSKIESELGISSTYYFNLRSEFYNLLEPSIINIVRQIYSLGHEIGIHFDASQLDVPSTTHLEDALEKERYIFHSCLNIDARSFSFHNPSELTRQFDSYAYASLVNAYSKQFFESFNYLSDSNGYWRFEPLDKFLDHHHERICVLTHPEWWQVIPMSPRERMVRCAMGRADYSLSNYDKVLSNSGRKNL